MRLRALVVEDDPASGKLLDIVLREDGWDVRVVESAEQAMAALGTFRPRIVLLDLVLPRMSGLGFARALKAAAATRELPIIAVTAYDVRTEALEAGCVECVRKPIDVASFPETIRAHLDDLR